MHVNNSKKGSKRERENKRDQRDQGPKREQDQKGTIPGIFLVFIHSFIFIHIYVHTYIHTYIHLLSYSCFFIFILAVSFHSCTEPDPFLSSLDDSRVGVCFHFEISVNNFHVSNYYHPLVVVRPR